MIPADTPAGTVVWYVCMGDNQTLVVKSAALFTHWGVEVSLVTLDGCCIGELVFLTQKEAGKKALSVAIERVREAMLSVDRFIGYINED